MIEMQKIKSRIPTLNETEDIPIGEKMIHRRYQRMPIGFYWLIAEFNPEENLAFGYTNLNDDTLVRWGYIRLDDLLKNGTELDKSWAPCKFHEDIRRIRDERRNM
jgi:hypothetical protein